MLLFFFLACLGGFLSALAGSILAYAQHLKRTGGRTFTVCQHMFLYKVNILLNLAGIVLYVVATGYGPVALATPMNSGTTLISNMAMQIILGISQYTKPMRVGTIVLVVASVALIDLGPTEQPNQDPLELLQAPVGLACMTSVLINVIIGLMLVRSFDHKPMTSMMKILGYGFLGSASTALGQSLGKLAQMNLSPLNRALTILFYVAATATSIFAFAMAAKKTNMALFLPLYYCLQLLLNCVIGLSVWQDYKVIDHWVGYVCVYVLVVMGSYDISSLDLFEHFGLYGMARSPTLQQVVPAVPAEEEQEAEHAKCEERVEIS